MSEKTLRQHQQEAGRSRSERKVAAVRKNLEKARAVRALKLGPPTKAAIYQRERRARLAKENREFYEEIQRRARLKGETK